MTATRTVVHITVAVFVLLAYRQAPERLDIVIDVRRIGVIRVGTKYEDTGYRSDVPKTAIDKAPNANVWRRTVTVLRNPDTKSYFVEVIARWEYITNIMNAEYRPQTEATWKIATERKIEVPVTSLGNRFVQIENPQ